MKSFGKRALWTTLGLIVLGATVGFLLIGEPPASVNAQIGKLKKIL